MLMRLLFFCFENKALFVRTTENKNDMKLYYDGKIIKKRSVLFKFLLGTGSQRVPLIQLNILPILNFNVSIKTLIIGSFAENMSD